MEREFIYKTIRDELLDQKRCQFQIFTVSVTLTSAILGYGGAQKIGGLVYLAPMLANLAALWLLSDKAISIQRKVGYLQTIEQHPERTDWRWETDLDAFRALVARDVARVTVPRTECRKHSFVRAIGILLLLLNAFCLALLFFGPYNAVADTVSSALEQAYLRATGIVMLGAGIIISYLKLLSLTRGENSTTYIQAKWELVLAR